MADQPTLILLPGHLCSGLLWQPVCDGLADLADCRVLSLTEHDSMAAMAESVLKRAPAKFALAGLSMGGYVAFEIMRRAPERIERLALLDTTAQADPPGRADVRIADLRLAEQQGMPALAEHLPARWMHPDHAADPRLRQIAINMALEIGVPAQRRQQLALMTRIDSRPGLARIACPTLVLCGAQDSATPVAAHQEMHELISGSTLVVIDHCGHLSTIEQPQAVNQALREWLQPRPAR